MRGKALFVARYSFNRSQGGDPGGSSAAGDPQHRQRHFGGLSDGLMRCARRVALSGYRRAGAIFTTKANNQPNSGLATETAYQSDTTSAAC